MCHYRQCDGGLRAKMNQALVIETERDLEPLKQWADW